MPGAHIAVTALPGVVFPVSAQLMLMLMPPALALQSHHWRPRRSGEA